MLILANAVDGRVSHDASVVIDAERLPEIGLCSVDLIKSSEFGQ